MQPSATAGCGSGAVPATARRSDPRWHASGHRRALAAKARWATEARRLTLPEASLCDCRQASGRWPEAGPAPARWGDRGRAAFDARNPEASLCDSQQPSGRRPEAGHALLEACTARQGAAGMTEPAGAWSQAAAPDTWRPAAGRARHQLAART